MCVQPTTCVAFALFLLFGAIDGRSQAGPAPGMRLYGEVSSTEAHLIDVTGTITHTWQTNFNPGLGVYLLDDGSLLRTIRVNSPITTSGRGGGVQRIAFDGTLLWDFRYDGPGVLSHHDIEPMPNGNVLLIAWEDKTVAEAIAAGRDPATINTAVFRPDHIVEVEPTGPTTGDIVWEWHVWDHLIQDFDPNQANYGVVGDHPELVDINYPAGVSSQSDDWNHANGIDYDPVNDWIVLSAPRQDEIWIIDHSTTSAEAAGHSGGNHGKGGDLLYRWGNPAAYRAGTAADQTLNAQHNPRFIPPGYPGAGNLTVFNNLFATQRSAVFEIALPLNAQGEFVLDPATGRYGPAGPVWSYTAAGFFSQIISSAQRLPNGNTLICSGAQQRLFEVTSAGQTVWQHTVNGNVFHTHYVERTLWSSTDQISAAAGGTIGLDLVAGNQHSGSLYLMLGSVTGTAPGTSLNGIPVPLNPDFLWNYMAGNPNTAPLLNQTLGSLAGGGTGSASLGISPGLVPPAVTGLQMDFAYIVADPTALLVTAASNAVAVTILP